MPFEQTLHHFFHSCGICADPDTPGTRIQAVLGKLDTSVSDTVGPTWIRPMRENQPNLPPTRDLFPFRTSPARCSRSRNSRTAALPWRARRDLRLANGGRRPAATLPVPDPCPLLLQLYAGVPLLRGRSKEHPWAAHRRIGRRQGSERPAAPPPC